MQNIVPYFNINLRIITFLQTVSFAYIVISKNETHEYYSQKI